MSSPDMGSDLISFLNVIHTWDGKAPSFKEILIAGCRHAAFLQTMGDNDGVFVVDIAEKCNFPPSLIRRWIAGDVLPPPSIQEQVVWVIEVYFLQGLPQE